MALFQEFNPSSTYEAGTTVTYKGELWYFKSAYTANGGVDIVRSPAVWDPAMDYTYTAPASGMPFYPNTVTVIHKGVYYQKGAYNHSKVGQKPSESMFAPNEKDEAGYETKNYTDSIRTWVPAQDKAYGYASYGYEDFFYPAVGLVNSFKYQTCVVNLDNIFGVNWEDDLVGSYEIATNAPKSARAFAYAFQNLYSYNFGYYNTLGPFQYGASIECLKKSEPIVQVPSWPFKGSESPQAAEKCGIAFSHIQFPHTPNWGWYDYFSSASVPHLNGYLVVRYNLEHDDAAWGKWKEKLNDPPSPDLAYIFPTYTHPVFWCRPAEIVGFYETYWVNYKYVYDSGGNRHKEVDSTGYDYKVVRLVANTQEKNYSYWYDTADPNDANWESMFTPATADKTYPSPKTKSTNSEFRSETTYFNGFWVNKWTPPGSS